MQMLSRSPAGKRYVHQGGERAGKTPGQKRPESGQLFCPKSVPAAARTFRALPVCASLCSPITTLRFVSALYFLTPLRLLFFCFISPRYIVSFSFPRTSPAFCLFWCPSSNYSSPLCSGGGAEGCDSTRAAFSSLILTEVTEPVRSERRIAPYPTTTTSSRLSDSLSISTSITARFATATVRSLKPRQLKSSEASWEGTVIL